MDLHRIARPLRSARHLRRRVAVPVRVRRVVHDVGGACPIVDCVALANRRGVAVHTAAGPFRTLHFGRGREAWQAVDADGLEAFHREVADLARHLAPQRDGEVAVFVGRDLLGRHEGQDAGLEAPIGRNDRAGGGLAHELARGILTRGREPFEFAVRRDSAVQILHQRRGHDLPAGVRAPDVDAVPRRDLFDGRGVLVGQLEVGGRDRIPQPLFGPCALARLRDRMDRVEHREAVPRLRHVLREHRDHHHALHLLAVELVKGWVLARAQDDRLDLLRVVVKEADPEAFGTRGLRLMGRGACGLSKRARDRTGTPRRLLPEDPGAPPEDELPEAIGVEADLPAELRRPPALGALERHQSTATCGPRYRFFRPAMLALSWFW